MSLTLQQCKDKVATDRGFANWSERSKYLQMCDDFETLESELSEAAELYRQSASEWIKIDHSKGKNKSKPPVGELVLLGYQSKGHPEDHWVVSGHRDRFGRYWNQFQDKHSDCEIYPTHYMPHPNPPKI